MIAGAALLGAVGALIAIPAAATLQGFVSTYLKRYEVAQDLRIDRGDARRAASRRAGRSPARLVAGLRGRRSGPPQGDGDARD